MSTPDMTLLDHWIRTHDAEAFHELTRRHAAMLYGTACRILRDATEAEDVVQECFEQLLHTDKRPRAHLPAWLHRVAVNRCISRMRRTRHVTPPPAPEPSDTQQALQRAELQRLVDEALETLPDELRAPIIAHFLEARTHDDIARELRVERSTITRRIQRGVDALRTELGRRGVSAAGAALAAFFAAEQARALPHTLTSALGKLALSAQPAAAAGAMATSSVSAAVIGASWTWSLAGGALALGLLLVAAVAFLQPEQVAAPGLAPGEESRFASPDEAGRGYPREVENGASNPQTAEEAPTPPSESAGGLISGRVLDALTEAPIPDMEIAVYTAHDPASPEVAAGRTVAEPVKTNRRGEFSIQGLAPGIYEVMPLRALPGNVGNLGHFPGSLSGYYYTGHTRDRLQVDLRQAEESEPIILRLDRGAPVSGRVVDAGGVPVEGAVVIARLRIPIGLQESTETAADGHFEMRIPAIENGLFLFASDAEAASEDYGPLTLPATGLEEVELALTIPRNSAIAGIVVDPSGTPLPDIDISLLTPPNIEAPLSTVPPRTDGPSGRSTGNGTFQITRLLPGDYRVMIGRPGGMITLPSGERRTTAGGPTTLAAEIHLEPGQSLRNLRLVYDAAEQRLHTAATAPEAMNRVLARVIDAATDDPVRAFEFFQLRGHRSQLNPRTLRDGRRIQSADGTFTSDPAPVGEALTLVVFAHGFAPRTQHVVVPEEGDDSEVLITLMKGRPLHGSVVNKDGQPVADAAVYLNRVPREMSDEAPVTRTNAEGRFTLKDVNPNLVQLGASHPEAGTGVAHARADMTITLQPHASLEVLVLSQGEPAAGTLVTGQYPGAALPPQHGHTDADGMVRWEQVPPGELRVSVHFGQSPGIVISRAGGMPMEDTWRRASQTVTINPAQHHSIVLETGPAETTLFGAVFSGDAAVPDARIEVFAWMGESHEAWHATTDAEGQYLIEGLPAGTLELRVWAQAVETQRTQSFFLELPGSGEVEHDFHLAGEGVIHGRAHNLPEGLWGVVVLLDAESAGPDALETGIYRRQGQVPGYLTMRPLVDGAYAFEHLAPGRYLLVAELYPQPGDIRRITFDVVEVWLDENERIEHNFNFRLPADAGEFATVADSLYAD